MGRFRHSCHGKGCRAEIPRIKHARAGETHLLSPFVSRKSAGFRGFSSAPHETRFDCFFKKGVSYKYLNAEPLFPTAYVLGFYI